MSQDCGAVEAEVSLEVLSSVTDEALDGQLADGQFSLLQVTTDFTVGDGSDFRGGKDEASSHHRWLGNSNEQPWRPAAYGEPFL